MNDEERELYWSKLTPEQRAEIERQAEQIAKETAEMVERDIKQIRESLIAKIAAKQAKKS